MCLLNGLNIIEINEVTYNYYTCIDLNCIEEAKQLEKEYSSKFDLSKTYFTSKDILRVSDNLLEFKYNNMYFTITLDNVTKVNSKVFAIDSMLLIKRYEKAIKQKRRYIYSKNKSYHIFNE